LIYIKIQPIFKFLKNHWPNPPETNQTPTVCLIGTALGSDVGKIAPTDLVDSTSEIDRKLDENCEYLCNGAFCKKSFTVRW